MANDNGKSETERQAERVAAEQETSAAATLFDLRTVIGALFGSFGVILLIVALTDTTQAELDKAGGVHINLYTGIAMLVAAAVFFVWVRLRPPLTGHVEDTPADGEAPRRGGH